MSNTATLVDSVPFQVGKLTPVFEYEVAIDTADTELTIRTPSSTNRVFVVGIDILEASATNLTFISGSSSKTRTWELASNQGLPGKTDLGYYFATKAGEALKVRASVAIGSTVGKNFVLKVVEGDKL